MRKPRAMPQPSPAPFGAGRSAVPPNLNKAIGAARKAAQNGQNKKAAQICDEALGADPTNAEALHLRGVIAFQMRDYSLSETMIGRALSLRPANVDALNDMGLLLNTVKRHQEAIPYLMQALRLDPARADAHHNLADSFNESGNARMAENHYRIAIGYDPDFLPPYLKLVTVLSMMARAKEAEDIARQAIARFPKSASAYKKLGDALDRQGHLAEAMAAHKKALELNPKDVTVRLAYAHSLATFGQMDEAIAEYDAILATNPNTVGAHLQLSRIKKYRQSDAQLEKMHALYENQDIPSLSRSGLAFALAKANEDMREYKVAADYLIAANALRREHIDYSEEKTARTYANAKSAYTPEAMQRFEGAGNPDPTPIFVVGMPRSGTTLTEQIIASHPDVVGVGETSIAMAMETRWRTELEVTTPTEALEKTTPEFLAELGRAYVRQVRKYSSDAKYIVDKMPANHQYLGFIKLILPNAKVVHCRRSAPDTCLSIFKQSFNSQAQPFSYDMTELGHYYHFYADLMAYWHELMPGWIRDSQYEELVADQEARSRELITGLGLDWNDKVLDFYRNDGSVHTASIAQVRQPIYKTSVGLFEKYGQGIAPLLDALGPELSGAGK